MFLAGVSAYCAMQWLTMRAGNDPERSVARIERFEVDCEFDGILSQSVIVGMPRRLADVVVAVSANTQYLFAKQLLGRLPEPGIIVQRRNERSGGVHQVSLKPGPAIVLVARINASNPKSNS